jgi:hypothetical protein
MAPAFWAAGLGVALVAAAPAMADEAPKYGGILTYMIPADAPPSFDAHREGTFATVHSAAPFYSVLIRVDPSNPSSTTDFVCDLCAAVPQPTDSGRTYTFKFLAKLASDHRKPDGLFIITPEMGPVFVETLPVRKFHGVGPATAKKMAQLSIETGLDLRAQTQPFLQQHFGKAGSYYYWAARGIDERPVRADRIRKSVGAENTFPADLFTYEAARKAYPAVPGSSI